MAERVVTLGADPEIPVWDNTPVQQGLRTRRGYIPACGLFGGDKGDPVAVGPEGGWLEDGVMLELNPTPAKTPKELMTNTARLLSAATKHLTNQNKLYQLKPTTSVVYLDPEFLRRAPPKAREFGCDPDYSAYLRGEPRRGVMEEAMREHSDTIRFAGGHVHIGISDWPEEIPKWIVVRFLDLLAGMPLGNTYAEPSNERTYYYGLPGLYREPKYGVEYRTPSNIWLREAVDAPYFLARVKMIANLFAKFEDTREELIDIYNRVNWDAFYEAYTDRQYGQAREAAGSAVKYIRGNAVIELCGKGFVLSDHRAVFFGDHRQFCTDGDETAPIRDQPPEELIDNLFNVPLVDAAQERMIDAVAADRDRQIQQIIARARIQEAARRFREQANLQLNPEVWEEQEQVEIAFPEEPEDNIDNG